MYVIYYDSYAARFIKVFINEITKILSLLCCTISVTTKNIFFSFGSHIDLYEVHRCTYIIFYTIGISYYVPTYFILYIM